MDAGRRYGAGDRVDDLCRQCKIVREHTVYVADGEGRILRVVCGWCGSQHNFRGGDREDRAARPPGAATHGSSGTSTRPGSGSVGSLAREPFPLVSAREQRQGAMTMDDTTTETTLEALLRRVFREECGLTPVVPAEKWREGTLVLKPGKPGVQEKVWPIETFFHKIVMLRNKLRVLEQQIGVADMPEELKLKLQGYVTGCYGTLTSFNVLFAEDDDHFRGSSGTGSGGNGGGKEE